MALDTTTLQPTPEKARLLWALLLVAGALSGCVPPASSPPQAVSGASSARIGYEGLRMCRAFEHRLWGDFLMVGEVVSIEPGRDMRINVLKVRDLHNSAIELVGYPREAIDRRESWYPCRIE